MDLEFGVRGPLRSTTGTGPIEVTGLRTRPIIAMLLVSRRRTVTTTDLIDADVDGGRTARG
ncbi:hypothetical protein AB0B86_27885 [Micromonospora sp. NPDC049047]